jgi:GNAT superfamily N-acetyltransferase
MMPETQIAADPPGASRPALVESMHAAVYCRKPLLRSTSRDMFADRMTTPAFAAPTVSSVSRDRRRNHGGSRPGMKAITLRPLGEGDSLDELTAMLHRAFSRLGAMGLNCTCVDQSVAMTRERIEKGACYVAVCGGRLVGTITLYAPGPNAKIAWYRRQAVASVHQLAVDPDFQDRGLGTDLLTFAEGWAREHGFRELALDTPQPAKHLVGFYISCGYRPVESATFPGKRYQSVVMSKGVAQQAPYAALMPQFTNPAARRCRQRLLRVEAGALPGRMKRWLRHLRTGIDRVTDAVMRIPATAQVGRLTPV